MNALNQGKRSYTRWRLSGGGKKELFEKNGGGGEGGIKGGFGSAPVSG